MDTVTVKIQGRGKTVTFTYIPAEQRVKSVVKSGIITSKPIRKYNVTTEYVSQSIAQIFEAIARDEYSALDATDSKLLSLGAGGI